MAIFSDFTVNGVVLWGEFGTGDMDGLVVRPGTNLTPEYVEAMKQALVIFPVVSKFIELMGCKEFFVNPNPEQQTFYQFCLETAQYLIAQNEYPLDSKQLEYVLSARDVSQKMIDTQITRAKQITRRKPLPGYVYLIQSPTSAYKIGLTKNPKDRKRTFGVKLPFEVEFIALIRSDDMEALEEQLHAIFADKRINGEWFNLTTEDVQYIQSLAGGAE